MVLTDEVLDRIARLSQEGMSVRAIAAELGLSKSSVARGLSQPRERPAAAPESQPPTDVAVDAPSPTPDPDVLLLAARRRRRRIGTP